ncbi:hypothetical protein AB0D46_04455 [Streptomyces sp. NPDC048383]|uniref:hypothetical protein n=1 Tax=Streptomyces sp. NPDC048383 TaxID=3155386 RepID=UPI00341449AB
MRQTALSVLHTETVRLHDQTDPEVDQVTLTFSVIATPVAPRPTSVAPTPASSERSEASFTGGWLTAGFSALSIRRAS